MRGTKKVLYLKEHNELPVDERKAYKQNCKKVNKRILIIGILLDLSILLFLKYFNFFTENLNELFECFFNSCSVADARFTGSNRAFFLYASGDCIYDGWVSGKISGGP